MDDHYEATFPFADGCEPMVIRFDRSIAETFGPEWYGIYNLDDVRERWAEQGRQLEGCLRMTISGALYDALYAAMAARQASLLVVTHEKARSPALAAG